MDSSRTNQRGGWTGGSAGSQGRSSGAFPVASFGQVLGVSGVGEPTLELDEDHANDNLRLGVHRRDPSIVKSVLRASKRGGTSGNRWKGHTLDLTGFDQFIEGRPEGVIQMVVNGLLRAVRTNRRVMVTYDPTEPWTAIPGLLGNASDAVYRRVEKMESLQDGRRQIVLTAKRSRRAVQAGWPMGADIVLLGVGRPNRASLSCQVTYMNTKGRKHRMSFTTRSPAPQTAALEALVALSNKFPWAVVAVPRQGVWLGLQQDQPANAHRAMALGQILCVAKVEEHSDYIFLVQ